MKVSLRRDEHDERRLTELPRLAGDQVQVRDKLANQLVVLVRCSDAGAEIVAQDLCHLVLIKDRWREPKDIL